MNLLASSSATTVYRHIEIDGIGIFYREAGRADAPVVVLLHGFPSSSRMYDGLIPLLAPHHRVIAPEQQAHGHSGDRATPLSFEQMADDTAALLEQLGIHDADVLGFSNGGVVALELAIRHPALVHRLVLCSSFHVRADLPDALWSGMDHASMTDMPPSLRGSRRLLAP